MIEVSDTKRELNKDKISPSPVRNVQSMMKAIPFLRCLNMKEAIDFYTNVLDFNLKYPNVSSDDWVVDLINGDAELGLTILEGDQKLGINVYFRVDEVDNLFKKYVSRGLVIPNSPGSPVHNGPIDQSWGMREFYVNDPSGNTLRFGAPIGPSI